MLTDYERYQLEWMIEHGHSLDELMDELTYYQNDLEATRGVNLTVSDVFDAWTSDRGFASLENDVITKDMIRAGIEHGVIRFEANPDPNDPWKTVCAIGNGWFYHVDTTDIPPDEYIRMNSRNVDMVVDEIYDELNSTVKSDYHDDFKRYLSVLSEEHHGGTNSLTGIPFDINETMENGGAYYNPERGIVIASFLLEQTSPRIEAYYGYTPYALASLIGRNADVTVDSDVMDIQDILANPSLPRRFDHEGAWCRARCMSARSPSMGNRPAPARRLPRWPRMWMPKMKSRKRKTNAGVVRATATQMVWFPFITCRLIYNIGCLRHSMDRKDE